MKRINYVLLAVVMGIITAGSLVSCKDYEEDLRSELQATQTALKTLEEMIGTGGTGGSTTIITNITNLNTTIVEMQQTIEQQKQELEQQIADGNTAEAEARDQAIAAAVDGLATLEAVKTELKAVQDALQAEIDAAKSDITNLKAEDVKLAARIAALEAKANEACACAEQVAKNTDAIIALTERVSKLEVWQTGINDWKTIIDGWKTSITTWQTEMNTWKDGVNTTINVTLPADIKQALDSATAVAVIAKTNAAVLEAHKAYLDSLAQNDNELAAEDIALNKRIDSLITEHNNAIAGINTEIQTIYTTIDQTVAAAVAAIEIKYDGKIYNLESFVTAIEEHVSELDDLIYENKLAIEALSQRVDTMNGQISELLGLKQDVEDIKNYLNQLITGVLIQATHNSIYGSFAIPTNTQSNVLAAYYGEITTGLEFPSAYDMEYADAHGTILTQEDIDMLGVQPIRIRPTDVLVSDAEDNAGKLYLTINPANVDFTGVQFYLVNSLDEASGVDFTTVQPSDKRLSFGWTRAVSNGFYEADARIEAKNVEKVKARINLNDLKDAIKDVIDRKDGINVTNVVSTVYNSFNDVLDANALKATWTDEMNNKEMAVYSQYAVAATAIKPLSYKFGQDFDYQSIPGFGRIENFLNRVFNRVEVEIKDAIPTFDLEKYKFTELKGVELKPDGKVVVKTKIEIDFEIAADDVFNGYHNTFIIKDKDGNEIDQIVIDVPGNGVYTDKIEKEIEIDITDSINEIFESAEADINSFIASINNDLQEINELMDELNKINEVSDKLTDGLDRIESKVIEYLDKINNKLTSWINSANKVLQPTMLVGTTDGYARLSGVRKAPTVLKGNGITLIPTSYTADILAPSYKRLVGVTNVWTSDYSANAQSGNESCLNVLNNANQNAGLAEVKDGNKEVIKDINLEKGFVYEFAYASVDYFGKAVVKKYYVTVK